jgi:hypothetical protein
MDLFSVLTFVAILLLIIAFERKEFTIMKTSFAVVFAGILSFVA